VALLLAALAAPMPAQAKPKKQPAAEVKKKKKEDGPPPVGDKSANEGAQGRINATEDAARGADSSQFERRP
jgi:hypothetical protein